VVRIPPEELIHTDEAMAAGRAPTPRRRGFDSFRPCLTPRSSSGSRIPASQAGDAGSNPARGSLTDAAVVSTAACGRAMPAVRVRTPPAASTPCLLHRNHMRGSSANGNTRGLHP
jgi:hypothetical protein